MALQQLLAKVLVPDKGRCGEHGERFRDLSYKIFARDVEVFKCGSEIEEGSDEGISNEAEGYQVGKFLQRVGWDVTHEVVLGEVKAAKVVELGEAGGEGAGKVVEGEEEVFTSASNDSSQKLIDLFVAAVPETRYVAV